MDRINFKVSARLIKIAYVVAHFVDLGLDSHLNESENMKFAMVLEI